MSKIAIVGCGNIGSRILQSTVNSGLRPLNVTIIERYGPSQDLARKRFGEAGGTLSDLTVSSDMSSLPDTVDLLVVSSSADQRLSLIIEALKHTKPAAVLLEKILFTCFDDYAKALTELSGIPCYVNTTRNVWPGYVKLLERLDPLLPIKLHYSGTDWNLGSNGIHMLSIAELLANSPIISIRLSDTNTRVSKRKGYVELTGSMFAKLQNNSTITLVSTPHSENKDPRPLTGKVSQKSDCYNINENKGTINSEPFKILYASQLGKLIFSLVNEKSCGLPSLQESSRLHLLYLKALLPILHPNEKNPKKCMVT